MSKKNELTRAIYFAGELFDHKHLLGNAVVGQYIDEVAQGRYHTVLPQNIECAEGRSETIRNNDLLHLLLCDVAVFNFDGLELDSGTVVEFMMAKMLDIPCVLMRSDFRASGDQQVSQHGASAEPADPWNLMCSFYPRSVTFCFNSMLWYHEALAEAGEGNTGLDFMKPLYTRIAKQIIVHLDEAVDMPTVAGGDLNKMQDVYKWAMQYPGESFAKLCAEEIDLPRLLAQKEARGVLG